MRSQVFLRCLHRLAAVLLVFVASAGAQAQAPQPIIAPEAVALLPAGAPVAPSPKAEAGRAEAIEVEGKPAVRLESLAKSAAVWSVGVLKKFREPIEQGQVCLVVVRARVAASEDPHGKGRAAFVLRGADYKKSAFWKIVDLTAEWRTIYFPIRAEHPVPAGEGHFNLFLGTQKQTVEISDLQLYRYPAGTARWDLPHMAYTYAGREPDALYEVTVERDGRRQTVPIDHQPGGLGLEIKLP